jgi:PKD repeat protein
VKRGVGKMSARTLVLLSCVVGMSVLVLALASCALFNKLPTAGFTIGPSTTGPAPFAVTLSGAPSSDPDGEIKTYSWDFGDGAQGTGKSVGHTYTAAGTYTIILTVTDNFDASDQAAKTVYVTAAEPAGPTASFTASPTSGTAPLNVTFDASGSAYAAGTIAAYEWTFGDGGNGFGKVVTHTFFSSGSQTFTVTLLVRGSDGKTATASRTVSVSTSGGGGTPAASAPSARFVITFPDTNTTVAPVRVNLNPADSRAAVGRTLQSYHWSFGDGSAATTLSPTVQSRLYVTDLTSKVFSATLIVVDDASNDDSITKTIRVENYQPVAGFEVYKLLDGVAAPPAAPAADWWTDDDDGLSDNRVTYSCVPLGTRTVWIRSRQITDVLWQKSSTTPAPNASSARPAQFEDTTDGPNMCFDPEGQTWSPTAAGPTWFPNRSWGIDYLSIDWGDGTSTPIVDYLDTNDTTASHPYNFTAGGVQSWTITVTAYDYLGAHASFQRTITMNAGGCTP